MAQVADTESIVIVNQVRGWNYSSVRLKRWTMEIWGHILDQLEIFLTMIHDGFPSSSLD